jgi:outer membrane cobalamin receptor
VIDPDGRPVPAATLIVEGPSPAPLTTVTDAAGAFRIAGLPAGRYRVRASSPGFTGSRDVDVEAAGPIRRIEVALRLAAVDEALVVTATQVDQVLSRLPDSTTVVTREDLQARQQFELSQALRGVPGLTVQQSGGPGTLTSLFTRGGESDYTLVLVDGIRENAFGGGIDLSQAPLAGVERVEIVRGPQSALYGADAIGGVVQIITRAGGGPLLEGSLEGGSRAMRRLAGSTSGERGGFGWHAGGDYFADEGYTGPAPNGLPVTNDDAEIGQVGVSLGWRHGASGADLRAMARHVETDRGTPGPYGSDPAGRFGGVDTTSRSLTSRTSGGVRWVQPWGAPASRVRSRVEVDSADYALTYQTPSSPPPFDVSRGYTRRHHARAQMDVAASAALGVTAGVEWLDERGGSTFIVAGSDGAEVPVDRSVTGVFGETRWTPGSRLSVTAGLRGERIRREALPGDPLAFTARPGFPEEVIVSVDPKLASAWWLAGDGSGTTWTRLHGAFGTGIRPPDAFEIAFTDNSGLRPERSRSVDVGVAQAFLAGRVQVDGTAFFNQFDDLIVAVGRAFSGSSRWRTDNISNARARGAELSAAWRPSSALAFRATYTFLSTEILAVDGSSEAPPPYRVGDPLLRRPRHQGGLDATWSSGRFGGFLQVLVRGEALDAEPTFGPTGGLYGNPGYAVTHLGGSIRVAGGLTVIARVLNLFDANYEEVLGYPAPGRTAYVGVRLAAGR